MRGPMRAAGVLALATAVLSCATARTPDATGPAADVLLAELLPAEALPVDLALEQRVTIRWDERRESFAAVLQKRGGELLLLGLGPMNSVGFRLRLAGGRVSFENRTGREMPFVPERILADVQRVFYPWIEGSVDCTECEREGRRGALQIFERIGGERLEERRFSLEDRPERGEIVVRYADWTADGLAPRRATLSNGWFGYEIRIDTTRATRLD